MILFLLGLFLGISLTLGGGLFFYFRFLWREE